MIPKMSQNIFNYATSELSQDAFISLLVSWFNSKDSELIKISKDFINSLYNTYFEDNRVLKIKSVKLIQQYHKIDVYFQIVVDADETIKFIIEDKTWTEPHSDQLNRYVQKISGNRDYPEKETEKCKNIVKIFFKTGHITEKDWAITRKSGYRILDTKWINDFLTKPKFDKIDHYIFISYKEFIAEEFYKKLYYNGVRKELKDLKYNNPLEGYVQYEVIYEIKQYIVNRFNLNIKQYIRFTRNGKRWNTWWTFFDDPKKGYKLFIKIASIKHKYRIRLIEYSTKKGLLPEEKEKSLDANIQLCSQVKVDGKFQNINIVEKKNHKTKSGKLVKESEMAHLNLTNKKSLIDNMSEFQQFLEAFLEKKNGEP